MHPILFEIGPLKIYSFGLMMGISFIIGNILLAKEFKRKKFNPDYASTVTLICLIGGVAGSKILYLFENWSDFIANPLGMAFSPGGLTFYGGFILAAVSIFIYSKRVKIKFVKMADAAAPALLLAYGIARIGCHLAGDGDYGYPTTLPWGTNYSHGTYPPSFAFQGFPDIVAKYGVNGVVPDTIPCHPTPIYELIICSAFFFYMWKNKEKWTTDGKMFFVYLLLAGTERFSVEFLRLNPRFMFGLSEAQIIAFLLIVAGAVGLNSLQRSEQHSV
ncbi:MAG: prolipoprotein diacylglyceryl transferase [Bacteroidota bacterium]|nr:prolipoprotein diacylglyceryl transferase [Bacteroidota bacterium]